MIYLDTYFPFKPEKRTFKFVVTKCSRWVYFDTMEEGLKLKRYLTRVYKKIGPDACGSEATLELFLDYYMTSDDKRPSKPK